MHVAHQTIYALSSGRVPCAIALVRVSGPQAAHVIETLAGQRPQPRRAMRTLLRDAGGEPIDDAIVLWFPQGASATGEDVAEFHVHGSRAVVAALFAAFAQIAHMRAAEPGEFTRRAFENGKLDLTEAEALDDLIHSDTDRQRKQALRQLNGLLGDKARRWREDIIEACALIEAGIDFSDEGDVPGELRGPALEKVAALRAEIDDVLASQGRSERLRDGFVVAIAGPPNVGKSTLINQLARREVAIVSPHAGTTRDVIEVRLDLDGYPIIVIDTAGIRETDDPVEQEGVRRAKKRAAEADLILWLYDGFPDSGSDSVSGDAPVWRVRNKVDLGGDGADDFAISAARGDGLRELIDAIAKFASSYFGGQEDALIGRARQRDLLTEAAAALRGAAAAADMGDELIAEEMRVAVRALGRLLGRVDVEDLLGSIFGQFCIGK